MSDDIVDRINAYLQLGGLFNPESANHDAVRDLLIDARTELAAAKESLKHFSELHHQEWQKIRTERDAAIAERDRLREALKPFSKPPIGVVLEDSYMFDACSDDEIVYETHGWPADKHAIVTVGHLRRARAALDGTEPVSPKAEAEFFILNEFAPLPEPASPWRDIESAPKDGTPILCALAGSNFDPMIMGCEDGVFGWLTEDMDFRCHPNRQPTHWMPLPAPPC